MDTITRGVRAHDNSAGVNSECISPLVLFREANLPGVTDCRASL